MIENLFWGLWNGLTAWPLLLLHVVGIWDRFPVYNVMRDGGWYQFWVPRGRRLTLPRHVRKEGEY